MGANDEKAYARALKIAKDKKIPNVPKLKLYVALMEMFQKKRKFKAIEYEKTPEKAEVKNNYLQAIEDLTFKVVNVRRPLKTTNELTEKARIATHRLNLIKHDQGSSIYYYILVNKNANSIILHPAMINQDNKVKRDGGYNLNNIYAHLDIKKLDIDTRAKLIQRLGLEQDKGALIVLTNRQIEDLNKNSLKVKTLFELLNKNDKSAVVNREMPFYSSSATTNRNPNRLQPIAQI